jgi:hypothetical protein
LKAVATATLNDYGSLDMKKIFLLASALNLFVSGQSFADGDVACAVTIEYQSAVVSAKVSSDCVKKGLEDAVKKACGVLIQKDRTDLLAKCFEASLGSLKDASCSIGSGPSGDKFKCAGSEADARCSAACN